MITAAIEVGREIAVSDSQRAWTDQLESWWNTEAWNGIDINLERVFPEVEQQRFWAQVFDALAWKCFHRRWGNQENETWQVGFIFGCHAVSLMLTRLVWKVDQHWSPKPTDSDGVLPDLMRLQM
jgi:hypothetical protein